MNADLPEVYEEFHADNQKWRHNLARAIADTREAADAGRGSPGEGPRTRQDTLEDKWRIPDERLPTGR